MEGELLVIGATTNHTSLTVISWMNLDQLIGSSSEKGSNNCSKV